MFNNYKFNFKVTSNYQNLLIQLETEQQTGLLELIEQLESQVNEHIMEQEKLLDSINNLQLQTQNRLDHELAKNFELQKQVNSLQEQLQQQNTQISFLNKSMKNVYIEQLDLFSPIKAPSLSPQITRTQSINKQVKRKLIMTDKENENVANYYSSIKKIKEQQYFLDEQEYMTYFKEQCIKEFLDKQIEREQELFQLWNKMQEQSLLKCQQLQETIDYVCEQMDINKQQHYEEIKLYTDSINQLEIRLSKYKVTFQQLIQNYHCVPEMNHIIQLAKEFSNEINNFNDLDKLIDILMEFNSTSQLFNQNLQNNQNLKIQQLQNQLQDLEQQKQEYTDIKIQRLELLELSQQMNSKILQQSDQIEEMNSQIASLTQLFAKSLQDLEKIQEENENLRKSYNNNQNNNTITTRTQDGSVSLKNHFIANRYSTYMPRESFSCKNSYRIEQRTTNFSSDFKKQHSNTPELDEISFLLDQLLNQGFNNNVLDFINNFQCVNGNFKMQLLWQKLKDLLVNIYYIFNQQDDIFISLNKFINDVKIPLNQFDLLMENSLLQSTGKLETNSILLCQLLHRLLSDMHDMKSSQTFLHSNILESSKKVDNNKDYSQYIMSELTNLSKQLINICQENDDIIVLQIERQIEIQEQLKLQRNKQLRDIQTSTCKILMELFKEWKQNNLHISQILLILCKGWQQLQTIKQDRILDGILNNVHEEIKQINYQLRIENFFIYILIMNPLIKKYYNQIIYGQYEKPVLNSDRIFKVKHLVALISEFLDDNEVLCLIQINKQCRQFATECSQLKIRVLEIRLKRQTKILDNYIQDPEYLNIKHNNSYFAYQFNQITIEQRQFIKIQDLLAKKKQKETQQQQLLQCETQPSNEQYKQNTEKQQLTIKSQNKKQEYERLLNEVYSLFEEEQQKIIPKQKIKLNDITRNLCPIVQYQRVKQVITKMKGSFQYEVKHI